MPQWPRGGRCQRGDCPHACTGRALCPCPLPVRASGYENELALDAWGPKRKPVRPFTPPCGVPVGVRCTCGGCSVPSHHPSTGHCSECMVVWLSTSLGKEGSGPRSHVCTPPLLCEPPGNVRPSPTALAGFYITSISVSLCRAVAPLIRVVQRPSGGRSTETGQRHLHVLF